jgi:hypothetical protein
MTIFLPLPFIAEPPKVGKGPLGDLLQPPHDISLSNKQCNDLKEAIR